jgi:hypothetical protein
VALTGLAIKVWLSARSPLEYAIALQWLARAGLGWVVVVPVLEIVSASGVTALEAGERALFEPGGLWLTELLSSEHRALLAGGEAWLMLSAIALGLLTIPSALVFTAVAAPDMPIVPAARRAVWLAPRFVVIGLAQALAGALCVAPALLSASAVSNASPAWSNEPLQDSLGLAVSAIGFAFAAGLAVVADLTRSALARGCARSFAALRRSLRALPAHGAQLFGGYVLACGLGALTVALAGRATELCRVEQPGALRVLAVLLIHASALLALVVIEVGWTRRVVAASARLEPTFDSGAP